tara:strand:+ start:938 stop:1159 length:222 start_codon:yes stop_codon:yes gene_type:complete
MKETIMNALKKKYEAEIEVAKATIAIYVDKPVGVGDHPNIVGEVDKQLEIIGCAKDKLRVIEKDYPNEDDIPF